jgi:hypothetical protein
MFDLFDMFDIYQQAKIGEQAGLQANSDQRITQAREKTRDLEQRYERLRLVTIAMWQLLKEHTGLTDTDLRKFVEQVDLLDGKLDGKVSRVSGATNCTECGRRMLKSAVRCPWCGVKNLAGNAFHAT